MTNYREDQLDQAEGKDKADAFDHIPAIKIRLKNGSTHWLSISLQEYQKIKKMLIEGDEFHAGVTQSIDLNWCIDDVLQCADNQDYKITREEAGAVLDWLKYKHDASLGISWDTLSYAIREIISERGE